MRNRLVFAVLMFALFTFMPHTALAWNCTTAGQVRVQVPTGTVGSGTGDGSGQVVVDNGLTFICEALPTATTGGTQTQTQSQTSASSSVNTNTNSTTGGTSSSTSSVKDSGNSANTNTTSSAGGGNGSNNTNTTTNVAAPIIPVASAYAPTSLPSAPCIKGFGLGVQVPQAGVSFGGGKVDVGCDERELARSYALLGSKLAACKILVANERSQKAGVTLTDCMGPVDQPVAEIHGAVVAQASPIVVAPEESLGDYARRFSKVQ
jgi:hypothetical protein